MTDVAVPRAHSQSKPILSRSTSNPSLKLPLQPIDTIMVTKCISTVQKPIQERDNKFKRNAKPTTKDEKRTAWKQQVAEQYPLYLLPFTSLKENNNISSYLLQRRIKRY